LCSAADHPATRPPRFNFTGNPRFSASQGMPPSVELTAGPSGQALIRLHGPGQSKVEVYQHGGHVTSWTSTDGREMLYLSPTAVLDGSKAIRGGIPVCFPQFGQHGPLKQHGFARTSTWALVDPDDADEDHDDESGGLRPRIQLVLTDSVASRQSAWPYKFKFVQTIEIDDGGNFIQNLDIHNVDDVPFEFSIALHAYFVVANTEEVSVPGLQGLTFADSVTGGAESTQAEDSVSFGKEVDRLYYSSSESLRVPAVGLELTKTNLPDVVIWNPYIEKTAALADMPNEDWKRFICVEPARVREKAVVRPGQYWSAKLVLKAVV
jgi:glucose-6-phosphate 1-epimerase